MPEFRDALLALDRKAASVFVVLDGAQFDHLPKALSGARLDARPLYVNKNQDDFDIVVTAPHLLALGDHSDRSYAEAIDAILELVADRPAAVFWQCADGEDVLFRHLRSINKIFVPRDASSHQQAEPGPREEDDRAMVLFRHADANVLAQILGEMTEEEFSRFIGPAAAVYFRPSPEWADGDRPLRALSPQVQPPPGPLRLSRETIDRINDVRQHRSRRRIVAYLRKTAPRQSALLDERELHLATAAYMKEARSQGIISEAAIGRWCYLQLVTNGEIGRQKSVVDFIARRNLGNDPCANSDERVSLLMRMASEQIRRMER